MRGSICIWARLSIWKTPVVSAAWIDSKVCAVLEVDPREVEPLVARAPPTSSTQRSTAESIPSPSRSILRKPASAQESLSHWTIWRPSIAAGTTGQTSISGRVEITIPPGCWEAWRGSPIASPQSSTRARQPRRGGALGADRGDDVALDLRRPLVEAEHLRHPLDLRGGSASALPRSRTAPRGR